MVRFCQQTVNKMINTLYSSYTHYNNCIYVRFVYVFMFTLFVPTFRIVSVYLRLFTLSVLLFVKRIIWGESSFQSECRSHTHLLFSTPVAGGAFLFQVEDLGGGDH